MDDLAIRSDSAATPLRVPDLDARLAALDASLELMRYQLIGAFRGELLAAVTSQTRSMLIGMVSVAALSSAAVLGAVQLG